MFSTQNNGVERTKRNETNAIKRFKTPEYQGVRQNNSVLCRFASVSFDSADEILTCGIQIKAIAQYFPVVLFVLNTDSEYMNIFLYVNSSALEERFP